MASGGTLENTDTTDTTGMEENIIVNAPGFDSQIDLQPGIDHHDRSVRSKNPSMQQIPEGAVTQTIQNMDPMKRNVTKSRKKSKQDIVGVIADDELSNMTDSQYKEWLDSQEKVLQESIKDKILAARKKEIQLMQKAQTEAFNEIELRNKEMIEDWGGFDSIRGELRQEAQKARISRQNQMQNYISCLDNSQPRTQVQIAQNAQNADYSMDNLHNTQGSVQFDTTIDQEQTKRSAQMLPQGNLAVTFNNGMHSGANANSQSGMTIGRGRAHKTDNSTKTIGSMGNQFQYMENPYLPYGNTNNIPAQIPTQSSKGETMTTIQMNNPNPSAFQNLQQEAHALKDQHLLAHTGATDKVVNPITPTIPTDPTMRLRHQGLWREHPFHNNNNIIGDSLNPFTPSRGRSRERRTPPFGVSRRRDNYPIPRDRNHSGRSNSPAPKNKSKSGINDTADCCAKEKLIWPQKQLGFKFLQNQPSFDQLQFEHLVVGELNTIMSCEDAFQAKHRIRLLQRLAYWKMRGAQWYQIRAFYAAVISGIESHELDWDDSYTELESMMIDRPNTRDVVKFDKKPKQGKRDEFVWYCKKFNTEGGCPLESGHNITTPKGDIKPALHICARCFRNKKGKKEHSECSNDCPDKNERA